MVIDVLENNEKYHCLHPLFGKAFSYIAETNLLQLPTGKYHIVDDSLIAIVNEYNTVDAAFEQCEAHKKYIDIQYIISGKEYIGHAFLTNQPPSQQYDAEKDYWLFADKPNFFSHLKAGEFAIFFPTDLHMPNIQILNPAPVKKLVLKVAVL